MSSEVMRDFALQDDKGNTSRYFSPIRTSAPLSPPKDTSQRMHAPQPGISGRPKMHRLSYQFRRARATLFSLDSASAIIWWPSHPIMRHSAPRSAAVQDERRLREDSAQYGFRSGRQRPDRSATGKMRRPASARKSRSAAGISKSVPDSRRCAYQVYT